MRNFITISLVMILAGMPGCKTLQGTTGTRKFVIILQAGTESHEGLARAVHALMYSAELLEAGHKVVLIFDGAGTEWAKALRDPQHRLHSTYQKLAALGAIEEVCDFCSGAFGVKEELTKFGQVPLVGTYNGHPSLAKWINSGYTVIVL